MVCAAELPMRKPEPQPSRWGFYLLCSVRVLSIETFTGSGWRRDHSSTGRSGE